MNPRQSHAISRFHELHKSGCFVLPNPWDVGTVLYLEDLGFQALATTSAGLAFSKGSPDALGVVSRDNALAHIRDIVAAQISNGIDQIPRQGRHYSHSRSSLCSLEPHPH